MKPEMFSDEWFVSRSPLTRLLYLGLWCFADDAGRFPANIALIHGQLAPLDSRRMVAKSFSDLESAEKIVGYDVNEMRYGVIPMFALHQSIDKPQPSKVPAPPQDVRERIETRLRKHPRWSERFSPNVRRMLYEDSANDRRMLYEDSANDSPKSPAPRARARLDQGTKGPRDQGSESDPSQEVSVGDVVPKPGGLTKAWEKFRVIHPECSKVSLEKFAEIVRVNPMAPLDGILERLRLELQGEAWPAKWANACALLRTRVVYGDVDAKREREATGNGLGGIKNAPPGCGAGVGRPLSAEELRERRDGVML